MNRFITVALCGSLLTGCAYQPTGVYERPDGAAFDKSDQRRIASVAHWKLIAENEGALLRQRIDSRPVFVEKNPSSVFSRTYHNLLNSSLVRNGASVFTEKREGSIKAVLRSHTRCKWFVKMVEGKHRACMGISRFP